MKINSKVEKTTVKGGLNLKYSIGFNYSRNTRRFKSPSDSNVRDGKFPGYQVKSAKRFLMADFSEISKTT